MMWRSRSTTETATSAAQKKEATAASAEKPKASTEAPTRSAVRNSTRGYFQGMVSPQLRQRPCRKR
jgi:hypothetical protein